MYYIVIFLHNYLSSIAIPNKTEEKVTLPIYTLMYYIVIFLMKKNNNNSHECINCYNLHVLKQMSKYKKNNIAN